MVSFGGEEGKSHQGDFANQASQANRLMLERRLDPCMSEVFPWADIPRAHTKMWKNEHLPGNMAVLVNAHTALGNREAAEAAAAEAADVRQSLSRNPPSGPAQPGMA